MPLENSGEEAKPRLWVIENNPREFLKATQKFEEDLEKDIPLFQADLVKDFFRSLTLVKLEAETPSDTVDRLTGIRVVSLDIRKGPYPMHPTPTH